MRKEGREGGEEKKEEEKEEKKEEEKEEENEKRGEVKWKGYCAHVEKKKQDIKVSSDISLPSHQSEWSLAPQLHLGSPSCLQCHSNQTKYNYWLCMHFQADLRLYSVYNNIPSSCENVDFHIRCRNCPTLLHVHV